MRLIRTKELCSKIGLSRTTIWRLCTNDSTFPKPIVISSRAIGWFEADIDAWMFGKREVSELTIERPDQEVPIV